MELIGISGKPRHGKDTIADALVERYGFVKIPFAKELKRVVSVVFEIPLERLNGDNKDSPYPQPLLLTKTLICHLLDELGVNDTDIEVDLIQKFNCKEIISDRQLLQTVGTDIVRKCIDNDYWINKFIEEVKQHEKVVCSDARMPNERKLIRDLDGEVILVKRPNFDTGDTHESENSLGEDGEYDVIVTNDYTVFSLKSEIQFWYEWVRSRRVKSYSSKRMFKK